MAFFLFTMYFQGGIIPNYILIQQLGLINSLWSLILINALNVYYFIICRTFYTDDMFEQLREAVKIDGGDDIRFFWQFVIPLSKALTAVMCLYFALIYWNKWFEASLYITDQKKWPLQLVLRSILVTADYSAESIENLEALEAAERAKMLMKYGVIMIASVPVLAIYPLIQKHFVSGVMIGAIKG